MVDLESKFLGGMVGSAIVENHGLTYKEAARSLFRGKVSFGNGGDRDTLGAMACAISGAYLGVDAIPPCLG
jgi:ADP-ribosylglycohydrolase